MTKLITDMFSKFANDCSNKSSSFLDRLYYLIETAVPYTYPEQKNEDIPRFDKPILLGKK